MFDGAWTGGKIAGTTLTWTNGTSSTVSIIGNQLVVKMQPPMTAMLQDDGKLHWGDGDVWEKVCPMRRVLIVGGGLGGMAAARELRGRFRVTLVDPKEYFEFTPSIMRAYVDPSHWDSITFLYKEVLERSIGVGFIWGEVTRVDGNTKCAYVKTIFSKELDVVYFDYCIIANGCSYSNTDKPNGESPWYPTVQEANPKQMRDGESEFSHLDERHLEGRRRRILEERQSLTELNNREGTVLIVGAGFRGVQFACELEENYPRLSITISDLIPRCCHGMSDAVKDYCEEYIRRRPRIRLALQQKYAPKRLNAPNPQYWEAIGLPRGVDKTYFATNCIQWSYFLPPSVLSTQGAGSYIATNIHLQVVDAKTERELFGDGCIFAIGDCIRGRFGEEDDLPQVPKTGYTAEQQAVVVCQNIVCKDRQLHGSRAVWLCCLPCPGFCARTNLKRTWYPWGSDIFAISLGSNDGCVVVGKKESGRILLAGQLAAAAKELIESTKVAQCKGDHRISTCIWYLIHHCPVNLTQAKAPCLDLGLISRQ